MVQTRSASTALNKHKGLQQFFRWLRDDEQVIDRNPMDRVRPPKTPTKLVPVLREAETARVLDACRGKGFVSLRDEAAGPAVRQHRGPAVGGGQPARGRCGPELRVGALPRQGCQGPPGPKTARALSRYLRARDNRKGAALPNLWLAGRGAAPLTPNGIKIRLKLIGRAAGVSDLHAHRWRHSFAHEWKLAGADSGDLMLLLGWASEDMPRRYGASATAERAMEISSASASANVSRWTAGAYG
jgi:integrase/recombinase XerC